MQFTVICYYTIYFTVLHKDILISRWSLVIIWRWWMWRWSSRIIPWIMVIVWSGCWRWWRPMWGIMTWMRRANSACIRYYGSSWMVPRNSWINSGWGCRWRSVYMWRHSISCWWISPYWHSTWTWWTLNLGICACRARSSLSSGWNCTCIIF